MRKHSILYALFLLCVLSVSAQVPEYIPRQQGRAYGIISRAGAWVVPPSYKMIEIDYMNGQKQVFTAYRGDTAWQLIIEQGAVKRSIPFAGNRLSWLSEYYVSVYKKDSGNRIYNFTKGFITPYYKRHIYAVTDSVFHTTCEAKNRPGNFEVDTLINYAGKTAGIAHYYYSYRPGYSGLSSNNPIFLPANNGVFVARITIKQRGEMHIQNDVNTYSLFDRELNQLTPFKTRQEIQAAYTGDSLRWIRNVLASTEATCSEKGFSKAEFDRAREVNDYRPVYLPCSNYAGNYPALKKLMGSYLAGPVINDRVVMSHPQDLHTMVLNTQGDTLLNNKYGIDRNDSFFMLSNGVMVSLFDLNGKPYVTYNIRDSVYKMTKVTDTLGGWETQTQISNRFLAFRTRSQLVTSEEWYVFVALVDLHTLRPVFYTEQREQEMKQDPYWNLSTALVNDSILVYVNEKSCPVICNLKTGKQTHLDGNIYNKPRKKYSGPVNGNYFIDRGLLMDLNGNILDKRHLFQPVHEQPVAGKYIVLRSADYGRGKFEPDFDKITILDVTTGKLRPGNLLCRYFAYDEDQDVFWFYNDAEQLYLFPHELEMLIRK